jgi:hypothetical protein
MAKRTNTPVDKKIIEAWEGEGGAVTVATPPVPAASLSGSEAQVEWAERIRSQVGTEFDRVAAAFREVAAKQSGSERTSTEAILAILDEKRAEVLGKQEAGYFIHNWQEIGDQVRQMIFRDTRYQAIKSTRPARRR